MKQNKKEKHINVNLRKSKKIKVILPIIIILLLILGVITFAYSKNINLAKSNNEEQEVEEEKAQEIVLEDNKYMHLETDANGDKVPVPNGFVGSKATGENEIDTGFVIYEGEEEVNDSNVATAQTTRNQYVWVPVPDISTFYGTDANGKRWGKLYDFDMENDNDTGTVPLNWSETNGVMNILNSENFKEPNILSNKYGLFDVESNLRTLGLGINTTHELQMQLEKEFSKMIDSVVKYGGFYIGRYETGNLSGEQLVIRKRNKDITNSNWYTMYKKCKELEKNNTNVKTGIIWGNQFDRMLMWLIECNLNDSAKGKSKEEVIEDSTSWGNYNSRNFIATGSAEYTKANNIYDLAGNARDTTMEAVGSYRVFRGGNAYGNAFPACSRHDSYPGTGLAWTRRL